MAIPASALRRAARGVTLRIRSATKAPSPISALLSGIVIETGLYALIRVLYILFEPGLFKLPIALLAVLTMTLANVTSYNFV